MYHLIIVYERPRFEKTKCEFYKEWVVPTIVWETNFLS